MDETLDAVERTLDPKRSANIFGRVLLIMVLFVVAGAIWKLASFSLARVDTMMIDREWFVEKKARIDAIDVEMTTLSERKEEIKLHAEELSELVDEARKEKEKAENTGWYESAEEAKKVVEKAQRLDELQRKWLATIEKVTDVDELAFDLLDERSKLVVEYNTKVQTITDPDILNGLPKQVE